MHAANIMTRKMITTMPDATVRDAIGVLRQHHLHDLPVVDGQGMPVGIITARAILHAALPAYVSEDLLSSMRGGPDIPSVYQRLDEIAGKRVEEVMDRGFLVVKEIDPTSAIAALLVFLRSDSHNVLVTDEAGRLTGTISALDIVNRLPA